MKNDKPFVVQREWMYDEYDDMKGLDTYDEAYEWLCKTFDASNADDDWRILETSTGCIWPFPAYKLIHDYCPVCNRPVRRLDMLLTSDCHGISYRMVCPDCYTRLMEKGYDGEYYTEADENIDEYW